VRLLPGIVEYGEAPVTDCRDCGKKVIDDSDWRVQWKIWFYSHKPNYQELCVCHGAQIRESVGLSREELVDYPLGDRMADLRGLSREPRRPDERIN